MSAARGATVLHRRAETEALRKPDGRWEEVRRLFCGGGLEDGEIGRGGFEGGSDIEQGKSGSG